MTEMKHLGLKLRVAEVVATAPKIDKGSVFHKLDEYHDVETIISAVKKERAIPAEMWKVFDEAEVKKKHPELRRMKSLARGFAIKVRDLMKKQGVVDFLHLEMREQTCYLAGNTRRA